MKLSDNTISVLKNYSTNQSKDLNKGWAGNTIHNVSNEEYCGSSYSRRNI